MNFTRAVEEVNISEEEYRVFIEQNIYDTYEIDEYLEKIAENIKFVICDKNSKFKMEVDNLLKNEFVYIKNKDVYYCNELDGLFPNFNTFSFGENHTFNSLNLDRSKLNFSEYKGRSIYENELDYIYNRLKNSKNNQSKSPISSLSTPITYYDKSWKYINDSGKKDALMVVIVKIIAL